MDSDFLSILIKKYNNISAEIYVADTNARIVACSSKERVGNIGNTARYIISIMHAASIQSNISQNNNLVYYGIPIIINSNLVYIVVVKGNADEVQPIGKQLSDVIESTIEYTNYQEKKSSDPSNDFEKIASMILSDSVDSEKASSLMYRHELSPNLLRSVIFIHLIFHKNSYFNINLSLGYEASIEEQRQDILKQVKGNRYLNSQDLIYAPDRSTLLIIKSFLPTDEKSKVYQAMEEVCKDLSKVLKSNSGFSFSIAYGDFYSKIGDIHKSLKESSELIDLGESSGKTSFFSPYSQFLEFTTQHISQMTINHIILPVLNKLNFKADFSKFLLDTAEAFVDNCMSLSATAQQLSIHRNTVNSRIHRFEDLTGLFPSINFKDAVIIKMTALYYKQNEYQQNDVTSEATK